ncbi:MAG: sodium:solute symporter family protein [Spartobacteria bacterium]|nr:sodium:solute symporter family protein [Spartobacteria bacterium]
MTIIDYIIFALYMAGVLGIGFYFFFKNTDHEDYYVGSRSIRPSHVGLSIVATDVGGGFSIGLGGLGYVMGLSGSWLLFTGLVGAWLSAVFIIPRIKRVDVKHSMLTYPDFLKHIYNSKVALVAALISAIGYMGFTGAQVLAGAKLMAGTILPDTTLGMDSLLFALFVIGTIIIAYTVLGGLKAVIYTDTVQWIILLGGLIFFAAPFALVKIGGFSGLRAALPPEYFSLTNITPVMFFNWMITIIPIWLVGMTLYQRMFACKDVKDARKAWYIAGVFEYPIMAFVGVFLGMCSRVLFEDIDSEMGLPMLIRTILPTGITGIVVAAYFSAVMSTADSCLMASSGNVVNDLIQPLLKHDVSDKTIIRLSQLTTLVIGVVAIFIAAKFQNVLSAILYAYSFMVSGLFIPTLGAYFWKKRSSAGALAGMLSGGGLTLFLLISGTRMPGGLDATFFGMAISLITFVLVSLLVPDQITVPANKIPNQ